MTTMSAKELEKKLEANEKLHIIDVREVEEVANGMIPGSTNLPLSKIAERYTELDKGKEYILVCQAGGRSGQAQAFLNEEGYKTINMIDGMASWSGDIE
ncbi:MAG TPA: rhodanese-like domain-containing protein [Pseudogracilibacillus sp.]|nr:rhodanese-like domain-containing protein [Pseudogracilibacillus sp.]